MVDEWRTEGGKDWPNLRLEDNHSFAVDSFVAQLDTTTAKQIPS